MGYRDNDGEAYSHGEACIASRHVSTYKIWHKQAISFFCHSLSVVRRSHKIHKGDEIKMRRRVRMVQDCEIPADCHRCLLLFLFWTYDVQIIHA